MTSCDTNILFAACDLDSPHHARARAFLSQQAERDDFCLCEQVLLELYCLLRNPVVSRPALTPGEAMTVVARLRTNPSWAVVDVVSGQGIMERVWQAAAQNGFAYRRVFDLRLAFTLQRHGVREFATRNLRDFRDLGFARVYDPLA